MAYFRSEVGGVKVGKVVGHVVLAVLALGFLLGSWTTVQPQEVGIITRMGALSRTVGEGLHFKLPFFEQVTKMRLSEQNFRVDSQVYSKDTQTVTTQLIVNYQVDRATVERTFREVKNDYQNILIFPVLSPVVEEVFSRYTANDLVQNRPQLPIEVRKAIVERLAGRGVTVKGIEFTFDFDDAYEQAIQNKQVQEQQALAQANVTKQEEEKKKQEILKAEALAEKTRLEAQALASQQGEKVIAKIYAEAALEAAKKWNGQLPTQMIPDATLPFIQLGK